jgi:type IV pilus assembly protein PilQ
VDERTNTLLLQDTAAKLEDVHRLIQRLDVPVRQVLVESRIVIANNDFSKDLGVRFGFNGKESYNDHFAVVGGGLPGNLEGTGDIAPGFVQGTIENLMVNLPATDPAGAVQFVVGKVGSYLLQLELSAMEAEGRGEIVSSPRVITSDQNEAIIKQGVEIPYQEASSSGATSTSFKDAVLELKVTPQITPDDRVVMDLNVKQDNPDFSRQVNGVPPVDTREVETIVLVDNGETVVLGGVFERTKSKNTERVPFFGTLPYVGFLFKQEFQEDNNRELLIFITPKILKESIAGR